MRHIAALLFVLWCPAAHALNTWGTDMSDLWWDADESGWGVNIVHQRDVIFATFFVYGADGSARWYVAPSATYEPALGAALVFAGPLYEARGPYLGAPTFDPGAVGDRQVGTARFTLSPTRGTVVYTVDGVQVTKSIERQTFRRAEPGGSYLGAIMGTVSACNLAGTFQLPGRFGVTLAPLPGNLIRVASILDSGLRCVYEGTYSQAGRLGAITDGTFTCSGTASTAGTFQASEMEAGNNVIVLRYEARYGSCIETGRIGAIKP